jgi:hypothetical protein
MIYDPNKQADNKKAIKYLSSLLNGSNKFRIEKLFPKKSLKQNAYVHVLFSLYGIEFGHTKEEAKKELKEQLGYVFMFEDEKCYISISDMSTKQLSTFIDRIRNFSASKGCYLPSADEYKYNWWDFDEIIKNNRY